MPFVENSQARGKSPAQLEAAAASPGGRAGYPRAEMEHALNELFEHWDTSYVLPMLREDFTLKVPTSLPYGGTYTGRDSLTKLFSGTPGGGEVWESFEVNVERVLQGEDHFAVQLANRAVAKATGKEVILENLWLFHIIGDRIAAAQLYADTAAAFGPRE